MVAALRLWHDNANLVDLVLAQRLQDGAAAAGQRLFDPGKRHQQGLGLTRDRRRKAAPRFMIQIQERWLTGPAVGPNVTRLDPGLSGLPPAASS